MSPAKNCTTSSSSKAWDPLNHHTSKKPKELDARDLIPLQKEIIYKKPGIGSGKSTPPLPPKRNPGVTITSQVSSKDDKTPACTDSLLTNCVPPSDITAHHSAYDVPSSIRTGLFSNDRSAASQYNNNGLDDKNANSSVGAFNNKSNDNSVVGKNTVNQPPPSCVLSSGDQLIRPENALDFIAGYSSGAHNNKKEVRFAEDLNQKTGNLEMYSSNDGLSDDDETCTSGSYILEQPNTDLRQQENNSQYGYTGIPITAQNYSVV